MDPENEELYYTDSPEPRSPTNDVVAPVLDWSITQEEWNPRKYNIVPREKMCEQYIDALHVQEYTPAFRAEQAKHFLKQLRTKLYLSNPNTFVGMKTRADMKETFARSSRGPDTTPLPTTCFTQVGCDRQCPLWLGPGFKKQIDDTRIPFKRFVRACDVRERYAPFDENFNQEIRIVPWNWANNPLSNWPRPGAHTELTSVVDYDKLRYIKLFQHLNVCFCFVCSICRIYDPAQEPLVHPLKTDFLDHFFLAIHAFTTKGKADGAYAEARALYRKKGYDISLMKTQPERSTVDCRFDVWTAFQLVVNYDAKLWHAYPWIFQLAPDAGYHCLLTMPLGRRIFHYSPDFASTAF